MEKMNKRKVLHATAVGLSLAITPLLARHSVIDTYAQVALTPDEENAINNFLATEPVNGDSTNIGPVAVTQPTINYTFPGINNYTSFFQSRAQNTHLDEDYTYSVMKKGENYYRTAKIKDWSNVEAYITYTADPTVSAPGLIPYGYSVYAKKVTLIDQSDYSEFTVNNAVMQVKDPNGRRWSDELIYDRYYLDLPIEDVDPRFSIGTGGTEWVAIFEQKSHYWEYYSTFDESIPYDTIVTVDENLKTGDVVEDVAGQFGERIVKFQFEPDLISVNTYRNYTADDIYADLKTRFDNTTIPVGVETHAWGTSWPVENRNTSATKRRLRVGIDYTHYVTEDGATLLPTIYGLHGVETISGYQYVTTRHEVNGDRIHVYKPVPTPVIPPTVVVPPASPVTPPTTPTVSTTPATPKTGDAGLFTSTFMLFTGMIVSIGAFITKKKNL